VNLGDDGLREAAARQALETFNRHR
jgi:hypothetical protein